MKSFVSHLIQRHALVSDIVVPRGRNRFEPEQKAQKKDHFNSVNPIVDATLNDSIPSDKELKEKTGGNNRIFQKAHISEPYQPRSGIQERNIGNSTSPIQEEQLPHPPLPHLATSEKSELRNAQGNPSSSRLEHSQPEKETDKPDRGDKLKNEPFKIAETQASKLNPAKNDPVKEETALFSEKSFLKPESGIYEIKGQDNYYRDKKVKDQSAKAVENEFTPTGRPVIKVTIGQIDIKAIYQAPIAVQRKTAAVTPIMTLDDYLKKRNENKI